MKKPIIFSVLFFFSFALFPDTVYYRSDWVGLELEKIQKYRVDEFEYVLQVITEPAKQVKRLLKNQYEWKRSEFYFNDRGEKTDEYQYEKNILTSHLTFERKARIKSEELFEAGKLAIRRNYSYSSRGIDFVESFDVNGNRLYTDEYVVARSGRLRSLRRIYPDGTVAIIHFTYGEGVIVGEWEYRDGRIYDTKFNEQGKMIYREEWKKDVLQAVKMATYNKETGKLVTETEKNIVRSTKVDRFYDNDGNIVREQHESAKEEPFELTFVYDGEKKKIMRKKSSIGIEEWRYFYSADETLSTEEYYKRGFLEMRTIYGEPGTWYEEIYREEELFLRVYYSKDKKVREEFIQEGKVIRVKEY